MVSQLGVGVVGAGGCLLASSGQKPAMLLNILQCIKNYLVQNVTNSRLRNPILE